MNFRLTAILFGTIFVLAVVLLVLSFTDEKPATDLLLEELAALKPTDIDTVEIEKSGGPTIKIVRAGTDKAKDKWKLVEPVTAPADPLAVNDVVSSLLRAKPVAYPGLSSNPAAHGLQPPGLRVTLRSGERSATVNLGDVTTGSKGLAFVTTSARPDRPLAAPRSAFDPLLRGTGGGYAADLAKAANDYRERNVFPTETRGSVDEADAVSITAKGKTLSLARGSGGVWTFVAPENWGEADPEGDTAALPGKLTGVRPLLNLLFGMQVPSAADFDDAPDLAKLGLDDAAADRIKIELRTKDGTTHTAYWGNKADATGDSAGSAKWWVQVVGQSGAMRVTAGDKAELIAVVENPDPLRNRNLLSQTDKNQIDGVDLGPVKLRKVGGTLASWKLYGRPDAGDPQPVAPTFQRTLDALTERRIIRSFPPPKPEWFSGAELKATVKIWVNGFELPKADDKTDAKEAEKAEPKEKGKPVVLEFGRREGDTVHVRRTDPDGKQAYFLLPEKVKAGTSGELVDLLAAVTQTRLDLLDPNLKSFAPDAATKLTVAGLAEYTLERDEKTEPTGEQRWRFTAPDAQKGQLVDRPALTELLNLLGTLSATRFIEEAPSAEKLADYGLAPAPGSKPQPSDPPAPRLKVVVTLQTSDPADKERTYEFGKDAISDGSLVYARQAGRNVVFTVPRRVSDKLRASGDLRDKSIFRFDLAQVARVELTGWGDKLGAPVKVVLAKNKDGNWELTEGPSKYPVDGNKVVGFLNAVAGGRLKAFTTDKPDPDGRHKFNDGKQLFEVVLLSGSGEKVLQLRLGGPADPAGNDLYVQTSRLPAEQPVGIVEASFLKMYKEGPGVFAK